MQARDRACDNQSGITLDIEKDFELYIYVNYYIIMNIKTYLEGSTLEALSLVSTFAPSRVSAFSADTSPDTQVDTRPRNPFVASLIYLYSPTPGQPPSETSWSQ